MSIYLGTTGLIHAYYEQEKIAFTITDVGGQRNERKKWIHGFEGVTAVIYVAALNHYACVLFEDESKNAMIESLDLFFETSNLKWFKKTEMILFLNKEDLFRENIERDAPLSLCFNSNSCIYKKEYDDDKNYYPKSSSKKENRSKPRSNNMRAPIADDEDNMAMINGSGDGDYYDDEEINVAGVGGDYVRPSMMIDRENDTYEYRARSAIYPKPNIRYSAKNTE